MIDFSRVPYPGDSISDSFVAVGDCDQGIIIQKHEEPEGSGDVEAFEEVKKDIWLSGIKALNIESARRALRLFEDKVSAMETEAQELTVTGLLSAANATEMTGQTKRLANSVDARRKEIISEPDSFVRKVNGFVKTISDRLKTIEALLKRKLSDHAYQVELQRREIERKQNEARIELQRQVDAEAKAKGVESVVIAPVAMSTRKEPVRSDSAVSSAVMVRKHEVVDAKLVPREYLMVDDAAIKAAIKAGIREIEGVRIWEDAEMRVRRVG